MSRPLVFATQAYRALGDAICAAGAFESGRIEVRDFPDGEHYRRILGPTDGRDVAIVGGTIGEAETLEIYDLANGLVDGGARSLTLIVPYFGYSTMERAVRPGEVVTAKSRARLFSSIPPARFGNRILLLDLHTEGLPYYFEGPLRAVHVYGKPVISAAIQRVGRGDFVLACTDAGRAKWVESLANDLGIEASFVFKRRLDGDRTEVLAVNAQVQGRRVVIYDDMIRTGGSLVGAARAYLAAGASSVAAIATHAVFPGDSFDWLKATGVFDAIVCTDSHPRALELAGRGLEVESVAPLLAEYLTAHAMSVA